MRIKLLTLTFTLAAMLCEGCHTKKNSPPEIDEFRTDIQAIRGWLDSYMNAIEEQDVTKVLALVSDDVSYLPPNQPVFSSKENLGKWLLSYFKYCAPAETLTLLDFQVYGDFACLTGSYTVSARTKISGEEFSDKGKFVDFFRRQKDGTWICTQSIWNSDRQVLALHSLIPADLSGFWKLDLTKCTAIPNIVASSMLINQKGNDLVIDRTYISNDNRQVLKTLHCLIGYETKSTSENGTLTTKSYWNSEKQSLTITETLISSRTGSKKEYKRTTVYSLNARDEVLYVKLDDILPEGPKAPDDERHVEMIYTKY